MFTCIEGNFFVEFQVKNTYLFSKWIAISIYFCYLSQLQCCVWLVLKIALANIFLQSDKQRSFGSAETFADRRLVHMYCFIGNFVRLLYYGDTLRTGGICQTLNAVDTSESYFPAFVTRVRNNPLTAPSRPPPPPLKSLHLSLCTNICDR